MMMFIPNVAFADLTEQIIQKQLDDWLNVASSLDTKAKREMHIATHKARCEAGKRMIEKFVEEEQRILGEKNVEMVSKVLIGNRVQI
jgi:hypothetical protein